jgi:hypothetical protein
MNVSSLHPAYLRMLCARTHAAQTGGAGVKRPEAPKAGRAAARGGRQSERRGWRAEGLRRRMRAQSRLLPGAAHGPPPGVSAGEWHSVHQGRWDIPILEVVFDSDGRRAGGVEGGHLRGRKRELPPRAQHNESQTCMAQVVQTNTCKKRKAPRFAAQGTSGRRANGGSGGHAPGRSWPRGR